MATTSANRDLLFGLLALLNNFIDRDALLDAFHRWVGDRSKSLDEVLLERGALSPSRHMLLAGLVEEHIKLHGDDPEKSLATLSSIGSIRDDLSRIADAELHTSLAVVSAARQEPEDDPYRTVTQASLGGSTSAGSRFRILRPHAKGGLGQVSVALDQELDRPVALKEIQDRHADDLHSRARFVQEAEITGKLEHPGIIPVYGLGHDSTGRPFYAMRFIEGDSLKGAIATFHGDEGLRKDPAARGSRLRELLRRFTDVCNAVAYAHSRGVLHRDLKPGNIMLGPYGETLVVDWGLAKPSGQAPASETAPGDGSPLAAGPIRLSGLRGSRDETVAGTMVGTPAYASPEQVAGRLDLLGPASDVYGLGATLYALLTGQAPLESGELEQVLRRVQKGEIPPPRSIDPTIPRPLESICKKAMALKPAERYASARELAADVTRWLDDQPVAAYREPIPVRAARWMRRHRTLVTSTASVLAFGVLGLSAFATVLVGKNRELDRQRQRAERREGLAIGAVKSFRDAVQSNPDLKDQLELEGLRKALLKGPLEFFRKLRDELEADRDTRPEALAKLAAADYDLAFTTAEIGDVPDAIRSYTESIAIVERLVRDHPIVTQYQNQLAGSHHNLGLLLGATGHADDALESCRLALAIRERLVRDHPTITEYQSDLALNQNNIGNLLSATGHPDDALESCRLALAIWERLARDNPSSTLYQNGLAGSHHNLGNLLRDTGHPDDALESYRSSLAIRERLARDHPTITKYQHDRAQSHNSLGNLLSATGHPDDALESCRQALEIWERLARDHPTISEYQNDLAGSHNNIGILLSATGHADEAMKSYHNALKIWERLARDHAAISEYQNDLASSHNNIGDLLSDTGHADEAMKSYHNALEICERLAHDNPSVSQYQNDVAKTHNNIGILLSTSGHADEAVKSYHKALENWDRLARDNPAISEYQSRLGATWNNMSMNEIHQERWKVAREHLERAIEHQRKALAMMPRHPVYRQFLRNHLSNLTRVNQALNQPVEAVRAAREWAAIVRGNPGDLYNVACALALTLPLTKGEQQQALVAEAVAMLRQAVAAGWSNAVHTSRDPDLIPLRDRDDFRRLLAEMFDLGFPDDPFAR